MSAHRTALRRGVLGTVTALLVALVAASSAHAVTGHRYANSFGTTTPGQLSGVAGVTTRTADGDVFVLDPNSSTVSHYTAAGDFQNSFNVSANLSGPGAIAFDPSTGGLYLTGSDPNTFVATLARFSTTGTLEASYDISATIGNVTSLATDSGGRVYAGGIYSGTVALFAANGTPVRTFDGSANGGTPLTGVSGLATDSADNVYVADFGVNVRKFDVNGDPAGTVGADRAYGVAVNPANDDVYVGDSADGVQCGITRFTAGGTREERFGEVACPGSLFDNNPFFALSSDPNSGTLFAGNRSTNAVDRFVTFTAPGVTTGPAPATPGATTADVTGTVNPDGQANTSYSFEYGTSTTYGSTTGPMDIPGQSITDVPAADQLTSLKPLTTYHYRLRATNGGGTNLGEDRTFTTAAAPPTVSDEAATNVAAFTATLNAKVNPNSNSTTAYFEYGPASGGYPSQAAATPAGPYEGSDPVALTANIDDLDPEVTYHFRLVSNNSEGPTTGTGAEFTTKPAPPLAGSGAVTGVAGDTAYFSGTADTQGLEGTVSFVVQAKNSAYQGATAQQTLPAGSSDARPVSGSISGLPAGGLFEVRTRVQTSTQTVLSEPVQFSTASAAFIPVPTPVFGGAPLPAAPAKPAAPSNRFSTSSSVKGSKATVKVKVPGRGSVSVSGSQIGTKKSSPKKAGTVSVKVALSKKGRAALRKAKSKRLKVKVSVRYRPTGGSTRTATRTLTFRR